MIPNILVNQNILLLSLFINILLNEVNKSSQKQQTLSGEFDSMNIVDINESNEFYSIN